MRKITEKKDFDINPQKRGVDENLLVATPHSSKRVYAELVSNVKPPNSEFFTKLYRNLVASKEDIQELYGISDRTFQYWSNEEDLKPKVNHHAILLLSLDAHPDLELIRR